MKKKTGCKKEEDKINRIVENNLCSGCGVCAASCPTNAINIEFNKNKEYVPIISKEKCINCGHCIEVCPFSIKNKQDTKYKNGATTYRGFTSDESIYENSTSGGLVTTLLKELINKNKIDVAIHIDAKYTKKNEKKFIATISKNSKEIEKRSGTTYYPIEFSQVLKRIKAEDNIKKVAIVGVPCAIQAIRNLCSIDKTYNKKIKYLLALMCSHNVNGEFANYLTKNIAGETKEKTRVIFRDKRNIKEAPIFNNTVETEKETISKNRHRFFTNAWRGYFFALPSCLYCTDFFGDAADASFKDAWGFHNLINRSGESVVVTRNEEINKIFNELEQKNKIKIYEISEKELIQSQQQTINLKQENNRYLYEKKIGLPTDAISIPKQILSGIDNLIKKTNIWLSKRKIKSNGFFNKIILFQAKILQVVNFIKKLEYAIERKKKETTYITQGKTDVIYTAGFGGNNIGDEAQLLANLDLWKKLAPEKKVTILSPVPEITKRYGKNEILFASRNSFFGLFRVPYAGIGESKIFHSLFSIKYIWIRINAVLTKYTNRNICGQDSKILLKKLKEAEVLHIGGGGYLTGKTESRLYDYMALIKIAHYLDTDIILSGHTIGVWKNSRQKKWAKALNLVRYIGLRDNAQSVKDLKEIEISEKKIIPLFDDALFIETEKRNKDKKYIIINAHFWKTSYSEIKKEIIKIAKSADFLYEKGYKIILVSMTPTDKEALFAIQCNMKKPAEIFENMEEPYKTINIIKNANLGISMKHHPIIFAMSASIPIIGIYYEKYYKHKNEGAMDLFAQKEWAVDITKETEESLIQKISKVTNKRDEIRKKISIEKNKLREDEGRIIKLYLSK